MKREIKFRVWDGKKMYYPSFKNRIYLAWGLMWQLFDGNHKEIVDELHGGVLELFTGILDKNGKEVFEGDILEINGKKGPIIWISCMDEYDWTGWYCEAAGYSGRYQNGEVVGNIHENPEMLA
jgi:hypothetical protein